MSDLRALVEHCQPCESGRPKHLVELVHDLWHPWQAVFHVSRNALQRNAQKHESCSRKLGEDIEQRLASIATIVRYDTPLHSLIVAREERHRSVLGTSLRQIPPS